MIDLINIASEAVDNLIAERDYVGAISQIYIEIMGPYIFYGVFLLTIFGAYYIRKQSIIPVIIIGILLFSLILPVIPTPVIGLALIIIALGGGGIFYFLFIREKR